MAGLGCWGEGLCRAAGGHAACPSTVHKLCCCPGLESVAMINSGDGVMEKHPRAPVLSHTSVRAPLPACERQLHHPKVQQEMK